MSKSVQNNTESDIHWLELPNERPTKIIVFSPQEPCPTPNIIFGTVAEEGKKVGVLLSKLLNVRALQKAGSTDDFITIYESKDANAVLISIAGLQQISPNNSNHWLFGYPLVRDALVCTLLRYKNVNEVIFATTDMYSDFRWDKVKDAQENPACRLYQIDEIPEDLMLPMFVFAGLRICKTYGQNAMVMCFSASINTPLIKAAFADGIGLLPFMQLDIDLDHAKQLYDEWETATKEAEGVITRIMEDMNGKEYVGIESV